MTVHLLMLVVVVGLALPALAGPRILRSAAPALMRLPRVAAGLIVGSTTAWVLAALSIGPLLAWMVTGPDILPGGAAEVCSKCLAAADPFGLDRLDTAVPVILLLVVPVAVSGFQVVSIARELRRRHHRLRRTADELRHGSRTRRLFGHAIRVVDDAHPFAMTLPRRHGGIVLSSGALEALAPDQLRAVLAHEQAHLQQRHHLITAFVTIVTARMRWVPLFTAAESALHHYLEIAADDAARRAVGTTALASALLVLGQQGHPARHRSGSDNGLFDDALHALGPDRIRHLVEPGRGTAGMAATVATAFCLTSLALLAAVVHVPYAMLMLTGCF